MRENLSAPGNVSDWLKISKQALTNLNYYNISQDAKYARLSARYGYDEYIIVNIRNKDKNRVLLEFDVSSPRLVDQFKTASTQVIRKIQNDYKRKQEEKKYGPTPTYNVSSNGDITSNFDSMNTVPQYQAEEGDYIEQTRIMPDDTLLLKQYREDINQMESDSFRHKFRQIFNRRWVIWLMLFVLPPFGIFLLWYFHKTNLLTRIFLTTLAFLYFFLIWVGFFGIDTGFNRDSIQRFYQTQQYNVQRFFNRFNSGTDPQAAVESVQEPETSPVTSDGVIQREPHSFSDDLGDLFNSIRNFFSNLFGENSG